MKGAVSMKYYVDMYVQIIDRLLCDVITHNGTITPTLYAVWGAVPMCSVNVNLDLVIADNIVVVRPTKDEYRVEITVINSQNISSTAKYFWEHDEVENLVYEFGKRWSEGYYNNDVVKSMKAELMTQTSALSAEIIEIIDRFIAEV